jgi:putative transposase
VRRDFTASRPDHLWMADMTQRMLDVFSRRVVGWAMGARAETELVLGALEMAVGNHGPGQRVIHYSDHGGQYTSVAFTARLREAGILGSVGTVGDVLELHRGLLQPEETTLSSGIQSPEDYDRPR